jgi:hypothetical protein
MSLGNTVFAAILLLLFMVLIWLVSVLNPLYFYISTFRSKCAVPKMAVFCSSLTSCFSGMLLKYFLNDIIIIIIIIIIISGLGSSVGIATDYGLDGPGSNLGGDEIFCPSRPASCKMVPGLWRG